MPVSFQEILNAFDFAGLNGAGEAILCRQTGKIYLHSEFSDFDEYNDELPDDVEDDENTSRSPTSGKSVSASRWRWTLRANFCPVTSMRSDTCSARKRATRNSGPC
jgi:hypothetical protein